MLRVLALRLRLRPALRAMPTTRSSSRAAPPAEPSVEPKTKGKRKAAATASSDKPAKKAKTTKAKVIAPAADTTPAIPLPEVVEAPEDTIIPAKLSFDFNEAKQHLIKVDPRFEDLFDCMTCSPFENLEQAHPFSSLATSILGQQISWKAAKSITHKFLRLFDPSIPENVDDYDGKFFPTPKQVAAADVASLRTAGLSGRKAEYVQDLAARFSDGRLSTQKLLNATDEELYEMLIAVKGVGPWTVHMSSIFMLRRPNILPVGDLGVQRGVMKWFLAMHTPTYNVGISPERQNKESPKKVAATPEGPRVDKNSDTMPDLGEDPQGDVLPDLSGDPETVKKLASIMEGESTAKDFVPPPLPKGLTASILKSRLQTKKKTKGALLTPEEMEELTAPWAPYRSLAVYYMWSLEQVEED